MAPPFGFHHVGAWREPGPYRAALVVPTDADGRVLLQLRDDIPHIAMPGRWGLFGGAIEAGEEVTAAAAREFAEESGLSFPEAAFLPAFSVLTGAPKWGLLHIYRLERPISPKDISLSEGAGFGFCSRRQAEKLDLIPCIRDVLNEFWAQTEEN